LRDFRFGQSRILRKIAFDTAQNRIREFHLIAFIIQAALFAGVADECGFDQDGWDIRGFEHGESGLLDTSAMREVGRGAIGAGETLDLGDGVSMRFTDLREYTVLQVSRDRGLWIVLAAAILVLVGLLPALYTSRRKLWITAEADAGGTVLKVGGFALQRRSQFEEEFSRLVAELRRSSSGGVSV